MQEENRFQHSIEGDSVSKKYKETDWTQGQNEAQQFGHSILLNMYRETV